MTLTIVPSLGGSMHGHSVSGARVGSEGGGGGCCAAIRIAAATRRTIARGITVRYIGGSASRSMAALWRLMVVTLGVHLDADAPSTPAR
jgi:hypothetical protein